MFEAVCDTSALQYLHQIRLLHVLPALVRCCYVPPAVLEELARGKALGFDLPDVHALPSMIVREATRKTASSIAADLGPGETQVIMLALELQDAVAILDDGLARRVAEALGIRLTGTLGILLDAKRNGLVNSVAPLLERLHEGGFRLSASTRDAVLKLAGELRA